MDSYIPHGFHAPRKAFLPRRSPTRECQESPLRRWNWPCAHDCAGPIRALRRSNIKSRAANTIAAYRRRLNELDAWRGQDAAEAVQDSELAARCRALEAEGKAPATIAQAAVACNLRYREADR